MATTQTTTLIGANPERLAEVKSVIMSANNGAVPTLPTIALEVAGLANNPLTGMSEMVRIIRNDPALTAKVLRICNSRFYGMPGRVESLNMALVVLGMREMSNLVICLSIFKVFPEAGERFWKNSVACGSIARTIITKLNVRFHGIEYMAGLLHNVGGLLLEKHFPTEFSKSLFVKAAILQQGMDPDMVLIENEIIGCDHAEVGSWLMEEWGLPKLLVDACRFHHQPSYAPKDSMLIAAIVGLAGLISTPMISEVELDYNDLLKMVSESDQWMVIIKEHPEMSNIDLIEFMEKIVSDLEGSRDFIRMATA